MSANGAIQLDPDVILPEGAEVQVAVLGQPPAGNRRCREYSLLSAQTTSRARLKGFPRFLRETTIIICTAGQAMNLVFADTYYYLALLSDDDEGHERRNILQDVTLNAF